VSSYMDSRKPRWMSQCHKVNAHTSTARSDWWVREWTGWSDQSNCAHYHIVLYNVIVQRKVCACTAITDRLWFMLILDDLVIVAAAFFISLHFDILQRY
jgi:hypothetical protein